jgi:tetratricopeptide (TPR) repeat protein
MNKGMTNSQLLDHACALRDQGKLREAYEEFVLAAKNTDNILEQAGILLNAADALRESGEYELAKKRLDSVRELLSALDQGKLSPSDHDELIRLNVGVEVEMAQIWSDEGQLEEAIKKMTKILEEYEPQLTQPRLLEVSDYVQMRRAYLWTDMGLFEKAKPRLEEMESRNQQNSVFLFYLGHCCVVTREFAKARQKLERAISLGLPPHFDFQTHCSLGMALYELREFAEAKLELERGVQMATPRYIKEAKIWKWLEYTCLSLGLKDEAERYGQLARPS